MVSARRGAGRAPHGGHDYPSSSSSPDNLQERSTLVYNCGVRDATNLGWKFAAVLGGVASDALLDTYDQERRDHTKAMIDVSVAMGRLLCPTNKIVGRVRDATAYALDLTPPTKRWIAEMRYKPQPRFRAGALVNATGPAAAGKPVGQMFPQPASICGTARTSPSTRHSARGSRYWCGATTRARSSTPSRSTPFAGCAFA